VILERIKMIVNIFRKLFSIRKRKERELPHFNQLILKLNEIRFFRKMDGENKLDVYRLLLSVHFILEKSIQNLREEFKDEEELTGLAKDLFSLRIDTEELLYHPDVTHMLYDTEDMKIGNNGLDEIMKLHQIFYIRLSRHYIFDTFPHSLFFKA